MNVLVWTYEQHTNSAEPAQTGATSHCYCRRSVVSVGTRKNKRPHKHFWNKILLSNDRSSKLIPIDLRNVRNNIAGHKGSIIILTFLRITRNAWFRFIFSTGCNLNTKFWYGTKNVLYFIYISFWLRGRKAGFVSSRVCFFWIHFPFLPTSHFLESNLQKESFLYIHFCPCL